MAFSVDVAGARQDITRMSVMVAGTVRVIRAAQVMQGGQMRLVYAASGAMSAVASPASVEGSGYGDKPEPVFSTPTIAQVTGGQAPYTYLWTVLSATGQPITPTAAGMATTAFRSTMFDDVNEGVARCTVTDALGQTATCDCPITLVHSTLL